MDQKIIKTFEDGSVQALIVEKSWSGRAYYRTKFRRAFVKKSTGEMCFAYDYDDHHLESLRKVARQSQAWLQEQKANAELTGRPQSGAS
jgi:hypothetical protein